MHLNGAIKKENLLHNNKRETIFSNLKDPIFIMGKFTDNNNSNRNIEVISLDTNDNLGRSKLLKMQRMPYMSDPSIVQRVQKVILIKI